MSMPSKVISSQLRQRHVAVTEGNSGSSFFHRGRQAHQREALGDTIGVRSSGPHTECGTCETAAVLTPPAPLKMAEEEAQEPFMTSRLCVKGLPKHVNDQQLRQHFAQKGEVTDAKVVKAKDGTSRQFGFIGFRTVQEAQAAMQYLNKTFMGAQRIYVEFAERYGGSRLPRAWSKYTQGTSRYNKLHAKEEGAAEQKLGVRELKKLRRKEREGQHPEEDDPQLAEFLQLMQPRRAGNIWSNEDALLAQKSSQAATGEAPPQAKSRPKSSVEEAGAPQKAAASQHAQAALRGRKSQAQQASASAQESEDEEENDGVQGETGHKDQNVVSAEVSDMDYLKSRVTKALSDDADDDTDAPGDGKDEGEIVNEEDEDNAWHANGVDEVDEDEGEEDAHKKDRLESHSRAGPHSTSAGGVEEVEANQDVPSIEETARLFIRNLPYGATEADLAEAFREHGEISEVHLVLDRTTKKSKGIALIQYAEAAGALAAKEEMDGAIFQGRLLHVLPAHRPPPPKQATEDADSAGKGAKGFKAAKEADRKASAGNRSAWNTLFMRPDTVAAAIAEHYGVSRAELLDRDAADVPVRMALGETHVIALTKRALGESGVNVDALESAAAASGKAAGQTRVERSGTVLLVKNLPYTASGPELQELFGKFGELLRLVLPPTKTLALVEYAESADARRAFKSLAYKRFQNIPLYLEWAPAGIFNADAPLAHIKPVQAPPSQMDTKASGTKDESAVEVVALPAADEEGESTTIYVKNLAFATTDAGLQAHFDAAVSAAGGSIRSARVAKRKGPDGKPLSAGFGFVECSSEEVAKIGVSKMQGTVLDGHKLALQLSMRKGKTGAGQDTKAKQEEGKEDKKGQGTKLVVRNVAFEATRKDLMALFTPFGQIKSCRLPKKMDGNHRGFAFVDFLSKQEARSAADAVAGTHLYGRRLVIEWADADEGGLDELRAKTAARFRPEEEDAPVSKKQRKALDLAE